MVQRLNICNLLNMKYNLGQIKKKCKYWLIKMFLVFLDPVFECIIIN